MSLDWWVWLLMGLLLIGAELLTPGGFYLIFFGLGAILVGLLAAVGVLTVLWAQVLLFLAASFADILLFRQALVRRMNVRGPAPEVDSLLGNTATALDELAPGALGRVELRGTAWQARNAGGVPLALGQQCTVERVEGLTLWVRISPQEYLANTWQPAPQPAALAEPERSGAKENL